MKPFEGSQEGRLAWLWTVPALLIILATVFLFHWNALTYHFWPDDWDLVGPRAAAEFLADPSILVRSLQALGHFAPLQRTWYVAQSLLFQDHPLPYHLLNLALAAVAAFALFRLILKYGLSPVGAFCGSLFFIIAPYNMFVISWITGSNYLWLSLLMVLALSSWEDYLETGGRRHLFAVALLTLAAPYVHSIGIVLPLILGVRVWLSPFPGGKRMTGRAFGLALILFLAVGLLQYFPRILLAGEGGSKFSLEHLSLARLLQAIGSSLGSQVREVMGKEPFGSLVIALFLLLLVKWMVRRENWRVIALGIALIILTLIPPMIILNAPPDYFSTRMRYMTLPNLGFSLVLAVLATELESVKRSKWLSGASIFLVATFMTTLLVQTKSWSSTIHSLVGAQDDYLWKCADGYRQSFLSIGREADCRRIVIIDVFLKQTAPRGVVGNLLIQNTNHEVFHRFFRLSEKTGLKVDFLSPNIRPVTFPGDCVYQAAIGRLQRRTNTSGSGAP